MMRAAFIKLLAVGALTFFASNAYATFNITVAQTGGPAFATYNTSLTANTIELLSAGGNPPFFTPGLTLSYSINNNPAGGLFTVNNLLFVYQGVASPVSLQVTLSENAANFVGNGQALTGFGSFLANGNAASSFSNNTTFAPGTGGTSINIPLQNFTPISTTYSGSSNFISGAGTGTVSTVFNITITPNSNVQVSAAGSFGAFGVQSSAVPVPATALLGVLGVPVLAVIRRRRRGN